MYAPLHLMQRPGALEMAALRGLRRAVDPRRLRAAGVEVRTDDTGTHAEVPVALDPHLLHAAEVLAAAVGLPLDPEATFRLRDCRPPQGHPPHHDDYARAGAWLVATAVLYLDACQGGETVFPQAGCSLVPAPGLAAAWLNLDATGAVVPDTLHLMRPMRRGRRRALFLFFYARPEAVAAAAAHAAAGAHPEGPEATTDGPEAHPKGLEASGASTAGRPAATGIPLIAALHPVDPRRWPRARSLHLVCAHNLPAETLSSLHRAATARRLSVVEHRVGGVPTLTDHPAPGDLLYNPCAADAARQLERRLWQPGVGSFDSGPDGPFAEVHQADDLLRLRGVPMPRSVVPSRCDRPTLEALVAGLGGLPVVLKVPGGEGGVGVMRADTFEALVPLLEFLHHQGHRPTLQAFVPEAMHWRIVVVGPQVVAAYRNPVKPGDFRSAPSADDADYTQRGPAEVEAAALAACRALRLEFAGVDVLEHPSGRVYVLECNSPCYHPQAEHHGLDVAGPMLDHLLALADRAP